MSLGLAASPTVAAEPPHPDIAALTGQVSAERLRDDIGALVGFGTRHTLSDTKSDTRGIGAARRWVQAQFEKDAAECRACLSLATPEQTVTGARVPQPTIIQDVLAIQRGDSDPDRVIIISGHLDSRVTDIMNSASDAPGANDDGSGVAAVLEAARILSRRHFPATLVYAVLSGEEQGLYGGQILADYAKSQGWRVEAVLNNDIIGNTHGMDGKMVDDVVRVFSEGAKDQETPAQIAARKREGGELDSPSRNLSRYMADIADTYLDGFHVRQIYRADRFGRGGDQLPMQAAGYPAVRVTEADENYTRQHQDVRTENGVAYGDVINGVDFPYLKKVAQLNVATLASLAAAPPPPTGVKLTGAVTADTTVSWAAAPGAASYRVWWRETASPQWTQSRDAGSTTELKLEGVNIDDYAFGVSAVSADGHASPIEFPGYAGAFFTSPSTSPAP
jgi:Zn-dependent M28 family amino/carboxypeptidase